MMPPLDAQPELVCVVAAAANGVIGRNNRLPWTLKDDLARFKLLTMGLPLILGRKNHEAIGRALPGRANLVITRQKDYRGAEGSLVFPDLEAALAWCREHGHSRAVLAGGGELYRLGLERCSRILLTEVQAIIDGDVQFDWEESGWTEIARRAYPADERNDHPVVLRELVRTTGDRANRPGSMLAAAGLV